MSLVDGGSANAETVTVRRRIAMKISRVVEETRKTLPTLIENAKPLRTR